ncbi:MAG: ribonuclease P [Nanoarchaeota archaeon]|nr:ribonuclease P [Nanoarchaeota archaeon]MBU2443121.1 ribonuclease P [Nanoarchaeota archaeon]
MLKKYQKKSDDQLKIALLRIDKLFSLADEMFGEDPSFSDRYVKLARTIAMKYKISLKSEYKRRFCKHCYKYLRPGVNCRVRTVSEKLVYSCFHCKKFSRFSLKKTK